ncbi:MAG: Asp23/Gls24 family envelope stress response protein, partial [Lachnospiraceae bacterium]|nr:Asp23/Gls24 family envelope stress response protein [Lachnospiraceae bacterium]
PSTCRQVQTRVKAAIGNMTGLVVQDVNVHVAGIKMPV